MTRPPQDDSGPDTEGRGPDSTSTPKEGPGAEAKTPVYVCDLCGNVMLDLHCKLVCERCGYKRDCSDP